MAGPFMQDNALPGIRQRDRTGQSGDASSDNMDSNHASWIR